MKLFVLCKALCALFFLTVPAFGHEYLLGELNIGHPWARPTLGQSLNGAAYLTIENKGQTDDTIVAVETPGARKAELHTHIVEDSVVKMRKLGNGLRVPAGETVKFEPGSHHIMLLGVKEALKLGQKMPLTLVFQNAGAIDVMVNIEMQPAAAAGESKGEAAVVDHSNHGTQ